MLDRTQRKSDDPVETSREVLSAAASADAAGDAAGDPHVGNKASSGENDLSLLDATALLCTWSTSSSNVMYPFVFGVLGVVGGPLIMIIAFAINWQCTRWTVQAARSTGARTLGDLGNHLWGSMGRHLFEGSQMLFQQLFLPVALVLSAQSLQSLFQWHCNGSAILCFVALGAILGTSLSQKLEHSVGLAYCSIALILVQTVCIVWAVSATKAPHGVTYKDDDDNDYSSRFEYFIGAGNENGEHRERYSWYNVAAALGVFIYSCLPNCIVVETMAALKDDIPRQRMDTAVDASFAFYVAIYLITGLPSVIGWGGDIPIPISSVMRNDAAGILTKLILIYSTMLDFVLASVTVNRFLVSRFLDPAFLSAPSESANPYGGGGGTSNYPYGKKVQWAWYSMPSLVLATLMALLIPRLDSLTGLLNSFTGTTVQVTAVALCLLMSSARSPDMMHVVGEEEGGIQPSASTPKDMRLRYAAVGVYGVVLTVLIFSEAVYSIFWLTDYATNDFWCDSVGRR